MVSPANPDARPTSAPTTKTLAATGGSAVGGAIAVVVLHVISRFTGVLDKDLSDAITVIIGAAVTFLAGYYVPHGSGEGIVKDDTGAIRSAN